MTHPRAAKRGKETRNFTVRTEVRAAGEDNGLTLTGYACVTDEPYDMHDMFGPYMEVVRGGAFAKTLAEQDDVRLLVNHDGIPLARTKSGTLRLSEDSTGLAVEADLEPRSGMVNDVRLAMDRGDLDQMSFMFEVIRQQWSPDYEQRDITEVRLWDVSVVTFPANPATSAGLRADSLDLDAMSPDDLRALVGRAQRILTPSAADAAEWEWLRLRAEAAGLG